MQKTAGKRKTPERQATDEKRQAAPSDVSTPGRWVAGLGPGEPVLDDDGVEQPTVPGPRTACVVGCSVH